VRAPLHDEPHPRVAGERDEGLLLPTAQTQQARQTRAQRDHRRRLRDEARAAQVNRVRARTNRPACSPLSQRVARARCKRSVNRIERRAFVEQVLVSRVAWLCTPVRNRQIVYASTRQSPSRATSSCRCVAAAVVVQRRRAADVRAQAADAVGRGYCSASNIRRSVVVEPQRSSLTIVQRELAVEGCFSGRARVRVETRWVADDNREHISKVVGVCDASRDSCFALMRMFLGMQGKIW